VREHGIGVEDLNSVEIKRRDLAILEEKRDQHARGFSKTGIR